MSTPTKTAARKTAPAKPSPANALQNAMRSRDTTAVATLLMADLAEASALHESLLDIIAAQARRIQSFRGLCSLAIGQGGR